MKEWCICFVKKSLSHFQHLFRLSHFRREFFVDGQNNACWCRYQQNYFVEVVAENIFERCLFDNDVCLFWASNLAHIFTNPQRTIVNVVLDKNNHFWQNGFLVIHPLVLVMSRGKSQSKWMSKSREERTTREWTQGRWGWNAMSKVKWLIPWLISNDNASVGIRQKCVRCASTDRQNVASEVVIKQVKTGNV